MLFHLVCWLKETLIQKSTRFSELIGRVSHTVYPKIWISEAKCSPEKKKDLSTEIDGKLNAMLDLMKANKGCFTVEYLLKLLCTIIVWESSMPQN
jgi:hypothetical protein